MTKADLFKRNLPLVITTVLMCLWSLAYACDFAVAFNELITPVTESSGNKLYIDGADFTPIFLVLGVFTVGIFGFILAGICSIVVFVSDFIVYLLVYLIFVKKRKEENVDKADISFCRKFVWITVAAAYVVSVVLSGFAGLLPLLLLFWQIPMFAYLYNINHLKTKLYVKQMRSEVSSEIKNDVSDVKE